MKKIMSILLVLGFGFLTIGCGSQEYTEVEPPYEEETPNEISALTIADFGNIIEAAGTFWTELQTLDGRFAPVNFDFSEQTGYIHAHLLPSSGFTSIEEIRTYLLQYYTENWSGIENVWIIHSWDRLADIFIEFGGILYAPVASQGTWQAWETATHELIEQTDSHAVVETRVEMRYFATGNQNLGFDTFRFIFVGDRIDSGEFIGFESVVNYGEFEFVDTPNADDEFENEFFDTSNLDITELGATIVAAGTFWENWWHLTGPFAASHRGESMYNDTHTRLLPSSGFSSLVDVRRYLSNYFTDSWIDVALGANSVVANSVIIEVDGNLYINTTRAGFPRPDWSTVNGRHHLIVSESGVATVETTVAAGVWNEEGMMNPVDVTITFGFVDGRINTNSVPFVWFQIP